MSRFSGVCWAFRVPGTRESTREGMEEENRPVLSSTAALATLFVPIFRFSSMPVYTLFQLISTSFSLSECTIMVCHNFSRQISSPYDHDSIFLK